VGTATNKINAYKNNEHLRHAKVKPRVVIVAYDLFTGVRFVFIHTCWGFALHGYQNQSPQPEKENTKQKREGQAENNVNSMRLIFAALPIISLIRSD
jgi:hypothetical protein